MKINEKFEIRPRTTKEMAGFYNINLCTFRKWLNPFRNEIGEKVGLYYRPAQVKKIIELLGDPD